MSKPTTISVSLPLITDLASISSFNRGPLVTIFTPPSTCLSTLTFNTYMYFGHKDPSYFDPACFPTSVPSGQTQTQASKSDPWAMYYYSPGQCPSGWYHASTIKTSFPAVTESSFALSIGADTTAVLCCPSGYGIPTDGIVHQCQSTLTASSTLLYFIPAISQNVLVPGSIVTTTIDHQAYTVYGDGIPVWWQSSDLAAFAAASLTTSSPTSSPTSSRNSSTTTNPAGSISTPTATDISLPSSPDTDPGGLSVGAKVAIGVCVPLTTIAILLGIFFCFRYRRRQRQQHQDPDRQPAQGGLPELSADGTVWETHSDNRNIHYVRNLIQGALD